MINESRREKEKREKKKPKIIATVKKLVELVLNPRFLLCFGLAWIITNGWAYALLGIGIWIDIGWMVAIASGYLAFLWIPVTPEKIITIAISIFLLKMFFPKDEKTLGVLHEWYEKAKVDVKKAWSRLKRKRARRKEKKSKKQ